MCRSFDDPAAMTPDQRRLEIAGILARGVLRLRQYHGIESQFATSMRFARIFSIARRFGCGQQKGGCLRPGHSVMPTRMRMRR